MFIRKKGGSYYMVESRRENGKVKQSIVAYLGNSTNLAEAIARETETVERNARRPASDYKVNPKQWRAACRRELDFDGYCWTLTKEASRKPGLYETWKKWRDAKVDADLRAKHTKWLTARDKRSNSHKANLAKLWALVPEAERTATQADVEKILKAQRQEFEAFVRRLQSIGKTVVPAVSNVVTTASTTQPISTVVPEPSTRSANLCTTADESATIAGVVPEVSPTWHKDGTTYAELAE